MRRLGALRRLRRYRLSPAYLAYTPNDLAGALRHIYVPLVAMAVRRDSVLAPLREHWEEEEHGRPSCRRQWWNLFSRE